MTRPLIGDHDVSNRIYGRLLAIRDFRQEERTELLETEYILQDLLGRIIRVRISYKDKWIVCRMSYNDKLVYANHETTNTDKCVEAIEKMVKTDVAETVKEREKEKDGKDDN